MKTAILLLLSGAALLGQSLNVKSLGAICDGFSHPLSGTYATLTAAQAVYPAVTSLSQETDWAAIQKALDSLNYQGEVYIPQGLCITTTVLTVGAGSYIGLDFYGQMYYGAANAPILLSAIKNTAGGDVIDVTIPAHLAHSVNIHGLQLSMTATTGVGIDFKGDYPVGVTVDNVAVKGGAYGVQFESGSLSASIKNSGFYGQAAASLRTAGSIGHNLFGLSNVYFQNSNGIGWVIDSMMNHTRIERGVWESNAGAAIRVNAAMNETTCDTCWWEFPSGDMIDVRAAISGFNVINSHINGSNGSGGRNFMMLNSGGSGEEITFIGGEVVNMNGGLLLTAAADPASSSDPGYKSISVIQTYIASGNTSQFKGLYTTAQVPSSLNKFQSDQLVPASAIVANSNGGTIAWWAESRGSISANAAPVHFGPTVGAGASTKDIFNANDPSYAYWSTSATNANGNVGFTLGQGNTGGSSGNGWYAFGIVGTQSDGFYGLDTTNSGRNSGDFVLQTYSGSFKNVLTIPVGTNNLRVGGMTSEVGLAFSNLGTPSPGSRIWCTDCVVNATACAGSGSGAWAFRTHTPAWVCPF